MRKAVFALLGLVILALLWTGAWFAASRYASRRVDAFIAAEARAGREWTCPDRSVGGYPFALAVTCRDPTYAGQALGQRVEAKLGRLVATVSLADPTRLEAALSPPFGYRTSDGQTIVDGRWTRLVVDLSSLPDPRTLAFSGSDVSVTGTFPGRDEAGGHAERLDARFTADRKVGDPTIAFAIAIGGTAIPALDALLGGQAPVDVALDGQIDHAATGSARTPEEAMERWRRAGGRIALARSSLRRGRTSVAGSGTLSLDSQHRPKGRFDAEFVGLEPVLARYGISGNLAAVGSLIGTLFGGGHRDAPRTPGALSLPISLADGRLGVGPITTPVRLAPLY